MPRSLLGVFFIAFFLVTCTSSPRVSQAPNQSKGKVLVAQTGSVKLETGGAGYVGSKVCANCHAEVVKRYEKSLMGRTLAATPRPGFQKVECESCHGPASQHVSQGGQVRNGSRGILVTFKAEAEAVSVQNSQCSACHAKGKQLYWQGSAHQSRDVACVNCHSGHESVSKRFLLRKATEAETCKQCHLLQTAKIERFSHMAIRDGKLNCSGCHNPHGSQTDKMMVKNSVNETCYQCHAEKRGPFLWEHAPVRDNCNTCHEPHGNLNQRMLKVRMPRLCNQCHTQRFHPGTPRRPDERLVLNRACMNCHNKIHGSNHPSGMSFLR